MIRSFADGETERLFLDGQSRRWNAIAKVAQRKLQVLDNARQLHDLQQPPGNHLEALRGDRDGQHSIRVNHQYRICFEWKEGEPHAVEIVDYH